MSFLNEAGVVGIKAEEPDFSVANGVYAATISESKTDLFNGRVKWQITYKISPDDEKYANRTVSEWFDLDPALAPERKQFLVRRLASLQIGEEEQATLEPADILGTECIITVKNKPSADGTRNFTNIVKVVLAGSEGASVPVASFQGANF